MKHTVAFLAVCAGCIVVGVAFAIGWRVCGAASRIQEEEQRARHILLETLNRGDLLSACRDMMKSRSVYTNESLSMSNTVYISGQSAQLRAHAPRIVQDLQPSFVIVDSNAMQISCAQHVRIGLYAYAEDSMSQGGSEKLIDGLWLYDNRPYSQELRSIK
jgi:hypothetical protein